MTGNERRAWVLRKQDPLLAWQNQRAFYSCLFKASTVALRKLGADEKYLGGQIGLTGVLHTNNRQLDF
ncbi:MAG: hypothetical protein PHV05_06995, partial [Candidatus Riflebacteria bacterium]|nr:hypothetical protein [Candidatus Riflebacteria bacterium]